MLGMEIKDDNRRETTKQIEVKIGICERDVHAGWKGKPQCSQAERRLRCLQKVGR